MTTRSVEIGLWSAVAVAAAWAVVGSMQAAPFDLDELQHLHIAWNLHEGRWPYRDFYEHHGLVLALVDALMLKLRGVEAASLESLVWMRWVSCAALAGQLLVLHRLASRRSRDGVSGAMAAALLLSSGLVAGFGPRLRPDTLQTLFVLLGALALLDRRPGRAGAWLGLAFATHPKAFTAVAALLVAALVEQRPWDRALLRRWTLRLLPGLVAPTAVVGALYAALGGFGAWFDAALVSNVRLLTNRWLTGDLHPHTERWLWTNDAPMTALLVSGLVLLTVVARRHRDTTEGVRFAVIVPVLLLPMAFVPVYPQLLLVVVPFLALAAAHAALPRWWRWGSLVVAAGVVVVRLRGLPDAETPERLAQRTMVDWMLEHTSRDEPVVEVWPTDCPAFVFQKDPDWQWMLAANDTYAPGGTPTSALLDRVLRGKVMTGAIDFVAVDPASDPFLAPDVRAYLREAFEPRGCVQVRRGGGSGRSHGPSTHHE